MRNSVLSAGLASMCLASVAAAEPGAVWTPSAEAPAQLLTPLEMQRHDLFIDLAQSASSCTGSPRAEKCTPGGIDVVFFGTTSTEMWWWPDRGMPVWEQAFAGSKAVNFGSQGSRPESLLWRMRNGELDGYQAKLVVLQALGPTPTLTADELTAAYAPLIAEIKARQPQAKILIFDPPRYEQQAEGTAAAHAGIVDNETVFYASLDKRFIPDGVGYEQWADALEPWLERFAG